MALTKNQLIAKVIEEMDFTKKEASDTLERLLEIIKSTLEFGEDVLISEFGKFCVKNRAQRKVRNPATNEAMTLSGRNVVRFKCSGKLRDRMNGDRQR